MFKRFSWALVALAGFIATAHSEVWQARYGVAETFDFKLYNADGTLDVDEADGGTEVSVSCNEGAETTATNDFADEGTFYSIALTATEMQCERITVVVAATTTEVFFIQTIDSTSAMTPNIVQTGDSFARLGAPAGASVSADVAAIEGQTDDIGAAGAGLTAIDLPNQTMDITGSVSGSVGSVATGGISEASFATTAGAAASLGIIDQGTAQSATGTTLQLRSAAAFADDEIIGATCVITGGSAGVGQARSITDYVSSTDTATVATWTTTPTGTIVYKCFGTAAGSAGSVSIAAGGIAASSFAAGAIDAAALSADAGTELGTATWATAARTLTALDEDSTTMDLNATATGAAASVTGAVGSVTGAVGSVTGSVGSVAAGGITNTSIATDAIGSDEIAATGATEVATAVIAAQGTITGTCDSGSTTTCVDNALTQADATQLEDRLICFDDAWCALITTFTPGSDTATTTKVAPSTRGSKVYTIFPSTLE